MTFADCPTPPSRPSQPTQSVRSTSGPLVLPSASLSSHFHLGAGDPKANYSTQIYMSSCPLHSADMFPQTLIKINSSFSSSLLPSSSKMKSPQGTPCSPVPLSYNTLTANVPLITSMPSPPLISSFDPSPVSLQASCG